MKFLYLLSQKKLTQLFLEDEKRNPLLREEEGVKNLVVDQVKILSVKGRIFFILPRCELEPTTGPWLTNK